MKRIRIIGLALAAVFAVSAVAAASASATLPELVNKEGKELVKKGIKTKQTSAKSVLENSAKEKIECTGSTGKATASGTNKVEKAVVTFTGCNSAVGKCSNAGVEEIVTNELEGQIGYIEPKTNKEVGFDLWPSARTKAEKEKHEFKAIFAKFTCGSFASDEVRGSVISRITPVNKLVTPPETFTLAYEAGTNAGEQKIKKLEGVEGGVEDVLEAQLFFFGFKKANEQTTQSAEYEEAAELKA